MKQPVFFQWSVSNLFGWGVYGLNLLRHWQRSAGSQAFCIGQIHLDSLRGMDPLGLNAIAQPLVDSDHLRIRIENEQIKKLDGMVLHSLGNRFNGPVLPRNGGMTGNNTVGVIFFEDTNLPDARDICRDYDLIVTGSHWNEEVLRANGVENVTTVIQGIDPSLFHPAPRADTLEDRFAIFSGGKMEFRKAQDLVLLAFKAFASRHPEAILVTAWHSPWSITALTLNGNSKIAPVRLKTDGSIDMHGWIADNGIPANQYCDLGPVPNHAMPRVVREMDVAIFPNRCEGGTNLVAMECMAAGIPVIVADNTGQKDLTATGATYRLTKQGPVTPFDGGAEGWGESDVDEMVEALEQVWRNRKEAKRRGLAGSKAVSQWSWRNQIAELHSTLAAVE